MVKRLFFLILAFISAICSIAQDEERVSCRSIMAGRKATGF